MRGVVLELILLAVILGFMAWQLTVNSSAMNEGIFDCLRDHSTEYCMMLDNNGVRQ